MSSPSVLLAATVTEEQFACWARAATGIVLAVVAWVGYLGVRAAMRQHRDGRTQAASLTGAVTVVGVCAALGGFWAAVSSTF